MESLQPADRNITPKQQQQGISLRRPDVYTAVTEIILAKIANGVVPWQSPSISKVGIPRNFVTGKAYQGINIFLLAAYGYQSPFFLTFLQAKELGGYVKKGEHGSLIIKVGTWNKLDEDPKRSEPRSDKKTDPDDSEKSGKFLKSYTVFNACQIGGIVFPQPPKCETYSETKMAIEAWRIIEGMPNPPKIHEGYKAFPHYLPATDEVHVPFRHTFRAEWRFCKTMFHELAHSTGHQSRLNRRSLTDSLGIRAVGEQKKLHCYEELVAEMAAAFLGARAGIIEDGYENSAAYLKSWMDVLAEPEHKTWLVKAASEAQRAAEHILGGLNIQDIP